MAESLSDVLRKRDEDRLTRATAKDALDRSIAEAVADLCAVFAESEGCPSYERNRFRGHAKAVRALKDEVHRGPSQKDR